MLLLHKDNKVGFHSQHLSYMQSVCMIMLNLTCYNMYCVLLATSGVYLSLKGAYLANNSYVDVDDIGEDESALICHTNKTDCCGLNRAGEWYFPNGSRVQRWSWNRHYSEYFYRNRDERIVRLNRYGNSPLERGHFYCELPDANDVNKTLYVNICELCNSITVESGEYAPLRVNVPPPPFLVYNYCLKLLKQQL